MKLKHDKDTSRSDFEWAYWASVCCGLFPFLAISKDWLFACLWVMKLMWDDWDWDYYKDKSYLRERNDTAYFVIQILATISCARRSADSCYVPFKLIVYVADSPRFQQPNVDVMKGMPLSLQVLYLRAGSEVWLALLFIYCVWKLEKTRDQSDPHQRKRLREPATGLATTYWQALGLRIPHLLILRDPRLFEVGRDHFSLKRQLKAEKASEQ